jgi:hypothetical protein
VFIIRFMSAKEGPDQIEEKPVDNQVPTKPQIQYVGLGNQGRKALRRRNLLHEQLFADVIHDS